MLSYPMFHELVQFYLLQPPKVGPTKMGTKLSCLPKKGTKLSPDIYKKGFLVVVHSVNFDHSGVKQSRQLIQNNVVEGKKWHGWRAKDLAPRDLTKRQITLVIPAIKGFAKLLIFLCLLRSLYASLYFWNIGEVPHLKILLNKKHANT